MTKCIRKSVSILLMAAMVLTTVLSYTPDIVYGQGYEPNLKAKIDGDKLIVYSENANASEVISDVEDVFVNGDRYEKESSAADKTFEISGDELNITPNPAILKTNKLLIHMNKFEDQDIELENPNGEGYSYGLTVKGVSLGRDGGKTGQIEEYHDCVRIALDYEYSTSTGSELFKLLRDHLTGVSIDDIDYKLRDAQGKPNFILYNGNYCIYDQYEEGKKALENFRKNHKHKVVLTFDDGGKATYEDNGYVNTNPGGGGTTPGEQPPKPGHDGLAKQLKMKNVYIATSWGVKEFHMLITPKFNNDYASKVKYVYINNKKFDSSKFQYSLVKDTYKSSEEDVIKAVESNDPPHVSIEFKDGSVLEYNPDDNKTAEKYEVGKVFFAGKKYPLAGIEVTAKEADVKTEDVIKDLEKADIIIDGKKVKADGAKIQYILKKNILKPTEQGTPCYMTRDKDLTAALKDKTEIDFKIQFRDKTSIEKHTDVTVEQETKNKAEGFLKGAAPYLSFKDMKVNPKNTRNINEFICNVWGLEDSDKENIYQIVINGRIFTDMDDIGLDSKKVQVGNKKKTLGTIRVDDEDGQAILDAIVSESPVEIAIILKDGSYICTSEDFGIPAEKIANAYTFNKAEVVDNGGKILQLTTTPSLKAHISKIKKVKVNGKDFAKDKFSLGSDEKYISKDNEVITQAELKDAAEKGVSIVFEDDSEISTGKIDLPAPPTPPSGEIAKKYKIKEVSVDEQREELRFVTEPVIPMSDWQFADTVSVNGQEFPKNNFWWSSANDLFWTNLEEIVLKAKESSPIALSIKFKDGSVLKNDVQITPPASGTAARFTFNDITYDGIIANFVLIPKAQGDSALDELNKAEISVGTKKFAVNESRFMFNAARKAYATKDAELIKELEKNKPVNVTISFADGSHLKKEISMEKVAPKTGLTIFSNLLDGDYTLTYKAYERTSNLTKASTLANFFDVRAKLHIENGKKSVTFMNFSNADLMLDLALGKNNKIKSAERKVIKSGPKGNAQQVEYTVELSDITGIIDAAVLGSGPMGGTQDEIGKFDTGNYKKLHIVFDETVTPGWSKFKTQEDEEELKNKNDQRLIDALIANGVDTNNDGAISQDELYNAEGKTKNLGYPEYPQTNILDLEGYKLTDISMLRGLGPKIRAIILEGNKVTKLPDGLFSQAKGLSHIFMSGNPIENISPTAFEGTAALEVLDIGKHALKTLPENIFKTNTKLKVLYLADGALETLPENLLKNNKKLEEIYLDGNEITSLPDKIFNAQGIYLKRVELGENKLTSLPSSIGKAIELQQLSAANNNITKLPDTLGKLRSLKKVNFSGNHLKAVPTDFMRGMIKSANSTNATVVLDLMLNDLTSLPIDEMIREIDNAKAEGKAGRGLSELRVSRNNLSTNLSTEEMKKLRRIGVYFKNNADTYYPQKGSMGVSAVADKGVITLNQELDILEAYYWDLGDSSFFDGEESFIEKSEFIQYLLGKGRDLNRVDRSLPRDEGIKAILAHKGISWKIRNTVTKNGTTVYDKTNEGSPKDGMKQIYTDGNMHKGDRYVFEKTLYVYNKVLGKNLQAMHYVISFDAESESTGGQPSLGKTYKVPVKVNKKGSNDISAADAAIKHQASVVEGNGKYTYTVAFKAVQMSQIVAKIETFKVEIDGSMVEIQPVNVGGDYPYTYKFTLNNKADKVLASFKIEGIGSMMGAQEADMVFDWNKAVLDNGSNPGTTPIDPPKPDPGTDPKPNPGTDPKPPTPQDEVKHVEVWVKNETDGKRSIADNAIKRIALVRKSAGKYTYTVSFKPMSIPMNGQTLTGNITEMNVIVNGNEIPAQKSANGNFTDFTFTLDDKVSEQQVSFVVDVMQQLGVGAKTAILVFDWNGSTAPSGPPSVPPAMKPEDKSATVEDAIKSAENKLKDKSKYTEESVKELEKALDKAKTAVKGTDKEKEEAKKALDEAIKKLVLKNGEKEVRALKISEKIKDGYMKGRSDGRFMPQELMTRAEIASMLARILADKNVTGKSFTDIIPNIWYAEAVNKIAALGVMSGYSDGRFKPDAKITRAEYAVIIARCKGFTDGSKMFKDVKPTHWAAKAIAACAEAGIVSGTGNGNFMPEKELTRAECVVMTNRAFGIKMKADDASAKTQFVDVPAKFWAYGDIMAASMK